MDAIALRMADYPHPRTVVESHDLLLQTCLDPGSAPCASCSERAQKLLRTKLEELRTRLEMDLATVRIRPSMILRETDARCRCLCNCPFDDNYIS